jgi:hypothetical protein
LARNCGGTMKFDAAPTIPGRAKIDDQNGTIPSA